MATILMFVSWIFCLRPITWLLGKIISNKTVLGFFYEIFYLGLAVLYFFLAIGGLTALTGADVDSVGAAIFMCIVGILGTFSLGYGIFHYHKSDEDMTETTHDGYEGSYNSTTDTVTVREKTKETLTGEGWLAVLTSPLQVLIRAINLLLMFRCVFNKEYICDLAYYCHPDTDGILKTIFIDIVNIHRYE